VVSRARLILQEEVLQDSLLESAVVPMAGPKEVTLKKAPVGQTAEAWLASASPPRLPFCWMGLLHLQPRHPPGHCLPKQHPGPVGPLRALHISRVRTP